MMSNSTASPSSPPWYTSFMEENEEKKERHITKDSYASSTTLRSNGLKVSCHVRISRLNVEPRNKQQSTVRKRETSPSMGLFHRPLGARLRRCGETSSNGGKKGISKESRRSTHTCTCYTNPRFYPYESGHPTSFPFSPTSGGWVPREPASPESSGASTPITTPKGYTSGGTDTPTSK